MSSGFAAATAWNCFKAASFAPELASRSASARGSEACCGGASRVSPRIAVEIRIIREKLAGLKNKPLTTHRNRPGDPVHTEGTTFFRRASSHFSERETDLYRVLHRSGLLAAGLWLLARASAEPNNV